MVESSKNAEHQENIEVDAVVGGVALSREAGLRPVPIPARRCSRSSLFTAPLNHHHNITPRLRLLMHR
jgi:hypothetical protein